MSEHTRTRPKVDYLRLRTIRAALHVPPDALMRTTLDRAEEHFPGQSIWGGWNVELFHFAADYRHDGPQHPALNPALLHPWIALIPNTDGVKEERIVAYWRTWHPQVHGYIAWWWDPRQRFVERDQWQINGFQPAQSVVWRKVLSVLRNRPPRGRKVGWRKLSKDNFIKVVREAAQAAQDKAEALGEPLTQQDIIAFLPIGKDAYYEYLAEYNLTKDELLENT